MDISDVQHQNKLQFLEEHMQLGGWFDVIDTLQVCADLLQSHFIRNQSIIITLNTKNKNHMLLMGIKNQMLALGLTHSETGIEHQPPTIIN